MTSRSFYFRLTGLLISGAMIAVLLMKWGGKPEFGGPILGGQFRNTDVTVYTAAVPGGMHFGGLLPALRELRARSDVGSAVAVTGVYGENVIIARNANEWRTMPPGVVFLLDMPAGRAEVFLNLEEFDIFVESRPILASTNTQPLELDAFLRAVLGEGAVAVEK